MHAAVPYSSQQAGGAQSRTIPYRSRRFGIGSSLGYAAFEWLGSTWCLRGWSQQPPGITPMPATQPLSKRPLTLQLRTPFYVGSAGFGLMCASPDGPCDDVGGPDVSLRKTNSDGPDFLNCPADQELGGPFISRFFFWASCCSPDAGLLPSSRRQA